MRDVAAWTAALDDDRVNRELSWGWQAWVSAGGEIVVDEARGVDGVRRPLEPSSVHRLYCAGRPFTAVALALLVEDGRLDFDTCLGHVLDETTGTPIAALTLTDLLTNRSGLHDLGAAPFAVMPAAQRERFALSLDPQPLPGGIAAYDEYVGWLLAGMVVERVSGRSWSEQVTTSVLEPLGLSDEVFAGFDDDAWTTHRRRIAVNVDLMKSVPVPLLADATAVMAGQGEPAIGVYATMRGLGRFYESLRSATRPGSSGATPDGLIDPSTLARMLATRSVRGHDPELERDCAYGLGFMVGLGDHGFGTRVGPRAFGHAGFRDHGAFCDPERELVVALHFTGIVEPGRAEAFERERRIDDLYDALGMLDV